MSAMVYLVPSLILSALLLLFANGIAWSVRFKRVLAVFALLLYLIGLLVFPVVFLQGLLLGGAAIVCAVCHRGPSFFLPLSCGATLAAYGLVGLISLHS